MRFLYGLVFILLAQDVSAACNCGHSIPTQQAVATCKCNKPCPSWWKTGWAITAFSGPLTSQTTSKIFSDADFEGSGIVGLALSKKLVSVWNNQLDFEIETVAVQNFGKQTNFEIDPISIVARWRNFPWNKTLPTTIAIGDGLSIATEKPALEVKRRGANDTSKVLNYVMAEITISAPDLPNWALVARYHHRSGMFGAFNGVHDASTAFTAGIKYWF